MMAVKTNQTEEQLKSIFTSFQAVHKTQGGTKKTVRKVLLLTFSTSTKKTGFYQQDYSRNQHDCVHICRIVERIILGSKLIQKLCYAQAATEVVIIHVCSVWRV